MKVLLFNDTAHTWSRHAASYGPPEIPPHTGTIIDVPGGGIAAFVKVWDNMFLVTTHSSGKEVKPQHRTTRSNILA